MLLMIHYQCTNVLVHVYLLYFQQKKYENEKKNNNNSNGRLLFSPLPTCPVV